MTESEVTIDDENNDDDQQLIKLCLKKPKQWNWELTTSKSSSHILFPTIQLFDAKGKTLLAEASEAGFVTSSKMKSAPLSKSSSLRTMKLKDSFKFKVKRDSIDEIVLDPVITEPDDESRNKTDHHSASPVQVSSERGLLLRDANSKEFKKPTNEKPRTKPYSRSSSNSMRSRSSVSILERIREMKRSSSSSEDEKDSDSEEKSMKDTHKYSYKEHSRLGTLIVPKESFSNARRRPKVNDEKKGELIEK